MNKPTNYRLPAAVTWCLFSLLFFSTRVEGKNLPVVFIQLQVTSDTVPSTDTSRSEYYHLNWAYLKQFPQDLKRVVLRPATWNKLDLRRAAVITAGTGLLMLGDREINRFMARNQTTAVGEIAKVVEPFGNNYPPLILTGLYLTGLITKNDKLEHAALAGAKSLAVSTVIYIAIKSTIRRQRPFRTDNPHNFGAPFSQKGYNSFPSGHTNTIMSVATAMSLEYKHIKWVPYVCYSVAGLTALSRLYQNRHWASDIFFGGALGHFVTRAVYNKMTPKAKKQIPLP